MTVYVLEVAGKAVAACRFETRDEAQKWPREGWFRDDLHALESDGNRLWDGIAELHVREAIDEEADRWRTMRRQAIGKGEADEEDDSFVAFLVPVNDPTGAEDYGD